ncbi:Heat shock factor-binding protein 1 [Madurella mycetomatis]|uniref:Heat shock factor-binding protein 1 n=1 Tax=Madurella mycetomatis TaxID=100816 RepID=A0A175WBD2_9PEZI|nr:Heat shock factor-binding protein 1 [Madurella mycetomatis]
MPPNNEPSTPQANNTSDDARAELTVQLEDLLNTLSNKFAGVSSEIFAKMDEMSRRLDNLEAQLMVNKDKKSGSG